MDSHRLISLLIRCFLSSFLFSGLLITSLSAQSASNLSMEGILRFRVDNKVELEKDDELITIATSTIFCDNLVFDFIGDNGEITIYNLDTGRFVLLDPIHRIQTELFSDDLDQFLARLKELLKEKNDRFIDFMLDVSFEISRNAEAGEFMFQSKWIDYNVKTVPFDEAQLAKSYFQYSDQSTKLNIYLNPGSVTPFARLVVNQTLKQENCFPEKFQIDVYPKGKIRFISRGIKIGSEHKLVRRLSERDQSRIVRALHFTEQFPKMTFGNYYKMVTNK